MPATPFVAPSTPFDAALLPEASRSGERPRPKLDAVDPGTGALCHPGP